MEDNKQPCLFFTDEKIDNFSKATGLHSNKPESCMSSFKTRARGERLDGDFMRFQIILLRR
jgi:hypothetical protein